MSEETTRGAPLSRVGQAMALDGSSWSQEGAGDRVERWLAPAVDRFAGRLAVPASSETSP